MGADVLLFLSFPPSPCTLSGSLSDMDLPGSGPVRLPNSASRSSQSGVVRPDEQTDDEAVVVESPHERWASWTSKGGSISGKTNCRGEGLNVDEVAGRWLDGPPWFGGVGKEKVAKLGGEEADGVGS